MKTIDKILIGFLVLLLPIGVYISMQLINPNVKSEEITIDAEKLKIMVENYANMQVDNTPKKEIVVSSVGYATESGVLTVKGDAPSSSAGIMMSVTVLPAEPSPPPGAKVATSDDFLVLGEKVETRNYVTEKDGSFVMDYEIEDEAIVELRLEQDEAVKTIRFDLKKREQI